MRHSTHAAIYGALPIGLFLSLQSGCAEDPPAERSNPVNMSLIGQQPVNPNASAKARQVLDLLNSLPDKNEKKVISGQTLRPLDWDQLPYVAEPGHLLPYPYPYDRIQTIYDQSGYWVGIAAAEYTDWEQAWGMAGEQRMVSEALNPHLIAHSEMGGIVSLHFHPLSPIDGKYGPMDGAAPVTADEILDSSQPAYANWIKVLDRAALGLTELRDRGVIVLWRPLHARDAAGWWWGHPTMTQSDYRRIWAHMVDYFSNTWQLDNILYLQSWYALPFDEYTVEQLYAGSSYVDIVAVDHATDNSIPEWWALERWNLLSFNKPFGIAQIDCWGDRTQYINHIREQWPEATFFIGFDHPLYPQLGLGWIDPEGNVPPPNVGALLSDPWVMNAPDIFSCEPNCAGLSCGAGDGCGGVCGSACDAGCGHCWNGALDCDESGVDCGGAECGPCSSYSCEGGILCDGSTVTGTPDQEVCGEDRILWTCTPSGWVSTGNECSCGSSCPGACDGGYTWSGDCQCYPCWDWCGYCPIFYDEEPDCAAAVATCGC